MKILKIFSVIIVLSLGFYGCGSNNVSSTNWNSTSQESNSQNTNVTSKWNNEIIKETVSLIKEGINTGDFDIGKIYINLKDCKIQGAENLKYYTQAMHNIYTNDDRIKKYSLEIRIRDAKRKIKRIESDYDGPFSEQIKRLQNYLEDRKYEPEIGMNELELLFACGIPNDINTTKTANSISKQYVYDNNLYVYVKNGTVTTIQN
ncbi:hypothetical protein [Clostridium ganghwense]|uniref:Lipoprotein n=1 Tax=Clostridium ganghwense TaxID=312089 RepID=A0ABT4CRC4_9CLOT|nr:hypothetical protein [Clostridium ganghwense]MCY6371605.1 hypothetical protein [Clostridium ganghwense]